MLELAVKIRQITGRQNQSIRNQGLIPAVLYGPKIKNLLLAVKESDFKKIYQSAGESTLVKLKIESDKKDEADKKDRVVLIHDIAKDPVSDRIIHIDFYQVKMNEPIVVEVPLIFTGDSEAVERDDGVLVKNLQQIEVKALPQELPHQIEVDISPLKTFDDVIRIKDLQIPANVEIEAGPEEVVASVVPPRTTEEIEELTEAPAEAVEEVQVEEKGKAPETTPQTQESIESDE